MDICYFKTVLFYADFRVRDGSGILLRSIGQWQRRAKDTADSPTRRSPHYYFLYLLMQWVHTGAAVKSYFMLKHFGHFL